MAKSEPIDAASDPQSKVSFHWWEREFFIDNMGALLERLQADSSLIPCVREEENEDGHRTLYFFTKVNGKDNGGKDEGDDEGFNNSHACPPFCPPGQP